MECSLQNVGSHIPQKSSALSTHDLNQIRGCCEFLTGDYRLLTLFWAAGNRKADNSTSLWFFWAPALLDF